MDYILIAILAWACFGGSSFIEKLLLRKQLKDPLVLAFYAGAFSIFSVIIFLPFAKYSSFSHLLFDLVLGIIFFIAQFFFFKALSKGDLSAVVPITGALIPIFSIAIVRFGFGTVFYNNELIAILLLIAGTILISFQGKIPRQVLGLAVISSILFAFYYSFAKLAYAPFSENYAFVRFGSLIAGLFLLLEPAHRKVILRSAQNSREKFSKLIITKELIAGVGFVILNYSLSIGNPAIINSLQGVEYAFVFGAALLFSKYEPKLLKEHFNDKIITRRLIAVILIFAGLAFLQL